MFVVSLVFEKFAIFIIFFAYHKIVDFIIIICSFSKCQKKLIIIIKFYI